MSSVGVIRVLRDPRHRGVVVDAAVFLISLILFYLLGRVSRIFVLQAEYDRNAKLLIGFFFLALLLLQPWGPWLKRRPFHARQPGLGGKRDSLAGCWVAIIALAYLIMMMIVNGAATTMISEVLSAGGKNSETFGGLALLAGFGWAVLSLVLWIRFFLPPKKPPRYPFLASPRAEGLADIATFLNVILLQIVWGSVMASAIFWDIVVNTPLGKPNSIAAILGRFIVISVVALMVYFPARVLFLVEQKSHRWAWLTMVVANLPIILKALLSHGR